MCRLQGRGGEGRGVCVEGGGGVVYKTKDTLCQINVELTPHSVCRSAGEGGGGLKVQEEAFKVDMSHISPITKESQRSTIWTQAHHLFHNHSKKSSPNQSQLRLWLSSTQLQHMSRF